ncbi:hypothetical protein BFP97_05550 [Roseivirga sp. 4D4]|uniref:tellurite resistance TerB family protein n=1 Tax=Roseivirga sp. 4D4 TaxID=1889784 RepID=UPI000852BD7C|nr:TerB family tellurite resistance protein [Roseivirga sp. 4D4]OEK01008.1 hypothetical protein BFP97_05550 [Roseivirga sp. 4D4]
MKPEKLDLPFYENLARLFYAMATVDNHVRTVEKRKIKEIIETEWDDTSSSLDSNQVMYSQLKVLFEEAFDKEEAFQLFKAYFLAHRETFTKDLKRKIMHGVNQIANAFGGTSKSESVLVSRLYFLMWGTPKT